MSWLTQLAPRRVAFFLFAFAYLAYAVSALRIQSDSAWTVPVASSLLREGNANLDEYAPTLGRFEQHGTVWSHGHLYLDYPMGAVVALLPFLALGEGLVALGTPVLAHLGDAGRGALAWRALVQSTGAIKLDHFALTEQRVAGLYVAAAVVVVFLTARRRMGNPAALFLALVFGFGTPAYSTASRVFWQHTPSLLCVALVVFLLTRATQTRASVAALGFIVAFAYVCRPTNALSVLTVSLWVLVRHPRQLLFYALPAAVVAAAFLAFNLHAYHALFSPYGAQGIRLGSPTFFEALAGQLGSPNRGLLIFSPVLALGLWQLGRQLWARELTAAEWVFAATFLLHLLLIAEFRGGWWGGFCQGPRYLTDVLPYLLWFTLPPFQAALTAPRAHRGLLCTLLVLSALSVGIHVRLSNVRGTGEWNDGPPSVDAAPARVWDWKDLQILRVSKS